jgi:hypothetical protein
MTATKTVESASFAGVFDAEQEEKSVKEKRNKVTGELLSYVDADGTQWITAAGRYFEHRKQLFTNAARMWVLDDNHKLQGGGYMSWYRPLINGAYEKQDYMTLAAKNERLGDAHLEALVYEYFYNEYFRSNEQDARQYRVIRSF